MVRVEMKTIPSAEQHARDLSSFIMWHEALENCGVDRERHGGCEYLINPRFLCRKAQGVTYVYALGSEEQKGAGFVNVLLTQFWK
jgi:hypothetical protein